MGIIEWRDKFSVNVDEMDMHHKTLLGYLGDLQKQIAAGDGTVKAGGVIKSLSEYAVYHFKEEERLMAGVSHPELSTHIRQHDYFVEALGEMSRQYSQGALPEQSVVAFLRDWFINHVMQEDHKYGESMKLLSENSE